MLGDIDYGAFLDDSSSPATPAILCTVSTFLGVLVLLNLIIARMSDS